MRSIVALVLVVVAVGCKPPPPADVTAPPGDDAPSADGPSVGAADVVGHWSGARGHLVLRANRGRILGAYDHDDGTLVGQLLDGTLIGWWCETPTRQPDADAGEVELAFAARAGTIDGRWRAGSDGAWQSWTLQRDADAPPPELLARLDDTRAFCDR